MRTGLRRVRVALVVLLLGLFLGPVPAAQAAWCDGEAPSPATPLTGGGFGQAPPQTSTADPFTTDTPLASVYGWHPTMITYDTGCTPGSSIMPNTGTEIANFLLEPLGITASIGHNLMSWVVSPSWLEPIDAAVATGVTQVRDATWTPFLGLAVMIVAVLMLVATRAGRLDGTVTGGVWALIVLGVCTYLGSYPVHATGMVDDAVSGTVTAVASSFSGEQTDDPQQAIDAQWDDLFRNTSYRTWLEGSLGSSTSATAAAYGPELFRTTHLTWAEAQVVETDPDAGRQIIDDKAERFKAVAQDIEDADPYAYSYLQGERWGSRISTALAGLVAGLLAMFFLVIAPIGTFIGFIVIRVAVMFSPAAGVIFMIEKFRTVALGALNRVGKYIIMGPLWLVAGLIVLRLNAAVVSTGEIGTLLKIVLCFVISFVAWKLLSPLGGVPGAQAANRGAHRLVRTVATGWAASKVAKAAGGLGKTEGQDQQQDQDEPSSVQDRPVFVGHLRQDRPALAAGTGTHTFDQRPGGQARDVPEYTATPHRGRGQGDAARPAAATGPVSGGLRPGGLVMSGHRQRHLSGSPSLVALPAGTGPAHQDSQDDLGESRGAAAGSVEDRQPQDQPGQATAGSGTDQGQTAPADTRTGPVSGPRMVPVLVPVSGSETSGSQDTTPAAAEDRDQERGVVATGTEQPTRPVPEHEGADVFVPAAPRSPGLGTHEEQLEDEERGRTTGPEVVSRSTSSPAPSGGQMSDHYGHPVTQGREQQSQSGWVMPDRADLPEGVHEANLTYSETDHRPVFQIYRPGGESVRYVVDEQ